MRDNYDQIEATGATLLAIAPSAGRKADEYVAKSGNYPFPLLSDHDHSVFDAYDVGSKLLSLGQRPAMFVIDSQGAVTYNQIGKQQTDLPTVDEIVTHVAELST